MIGLRGLCLRLGQRVLDILETIDVVSNGFAVPMVVAITIEHEE